MRAIEEILAQADQLFEKNDVQGVEKLYLDALKEAKECGSDAQKLHLYNELIGYYRQLSQKEKLLWAIEQALATAGHMGIAGSVPYATTLLNVATGYRSIGELEKAAQYYEVVEEIYLQELAPNDMLFANLFNNRSLLCQEQGDYEQAEEYLLKALAIATENQAGFEIAVTYANLANTAVLAKQYERAAGYANEAIVRFKKRGTFDPHYCAALSALGMCYYSENRLEQAADIFEQAMQILEKCVGRNAQYEKMKANRDMCKQTKQIKGVELCRQYYETYGRPMIEERFAPYQGKIAVGLVGEGSDCFGYDDAVSRDHDWGPGFCIWVTDETYEAIGEELEQAYEALPEEFMGFHRGPVVQGKGRRGVRRISDFYLSLLGTDCYEQMDWANVEDYALAAATNGEVFADEEGVFSTFREKLQNGYPEPILYRKLAEDVAKLSQTGQYNYVRMLERGDTLTADRMLSECMGHIMRLAHHMNNQYPPHDKWLLRSLGRLGESMGIMSLLSSLHTCLKEKDVTLAKQQVTEIMEQVGDTFARELYARDLISDINPYLDYHTEELLKKASYAGSTDEELVDRIVKLEFEAFDKVKNEGGRAYCQNDWPTFYVMRKSQYLTWNRTMLLQYLYDFSREFALGHNLITEKYGRMMESTAPERYQELSGHFPELSEQKKAVIEQIVAIQMNMVEEFADVYPKVVGNARKLHTYEDDIVDTSYETYLRGEISTYSDKMLQLYGRHVVTSAHEGINIARKTIENTAKMYGYASLDEFEAKIN